MGMEIPMLKAQVRQGAFQAVGFIADGSTELAEVFGF